MASQGTPAMALLAKQKVAHALHTYAVDADTPNYGAVVASALGADPAQVFKTLVTEVDGGLTVAIVPVTGDIDFKALASALGGKRKGTRLLPRTSAGGKQRAGAAALADRDLAERTTGYVRGGISPLGQRKRLPTVLDQSALDSPLIYVSAGKRGLQVRLAPADLVRLTNATVAPISRA